MRRIINLLKSVVGKPRSKEIDENVERPHFSEKCVELLEVGHAYLVERQNEVEEEYQIGGFEKWQYNQETGKLFFLNGDEVKIEIDYEEVGSISKLTNTWLWAWGNKWLENKVKSEIESVRAFGIENNFEPLTKSKWLGDEYDGWEMTGVAAYLLNGKGAYRVPTGDVISFMIFKEIKDFR